MYNFVLLLKSLINKALEYKGDVNLKMKFVCITMNLLVTSPCSHDFFVMLLMYVY